ncbi:hypothetical protein HZY83_02430 [Gemella sp. GH3]|uniref:hypothetical protein n=1 Tax=unclassified Gemella TaxID=2624949 RepID=UPI0015D05F00|nr:MULTISPECIES: hypothetical protein [unclassified Gemella]MBF0713543.1 hypothetical protein [Gemella sp. GH3.1]NYS50495.1 hypothetical protein [Gemella sp. GH3]
MEFDLIVIEELPKLSNAEVKVLLEKVKIINKKFLIGITNQQEIFDMFLEIENTKGLEMVGKRLIDYYLKKGGKNDSIYSTGI